MHLINYPLHEKLLDSNYKVIKQSRTQVYHKDRLSRNYIKRLVFQQCSVEKVIFMGMQDIKVKLINQLVSSFNLESLVKMRKRRNICMRVKIFSLTLESLTRARLWQNTNDNNSRPKQTNSLKFENKRYNKISYAFKSSSIYKLLSN